MFLTGHDLVFLWRVASFFRVLGLGSFLLVAGLRGI